MALAGCLDEAKAGPCPGAFRANYFALAQLNLSFEPDQVEAKMRRADMEGERGPLGINLTFGPSWNETARHHRGLIEPSESGRTRLLLWRSIELPKPPTASETMPFDGAVRSILVAATESMSVDIDGRIATGMRGECVSHDSSIMINGAGRIAAPAGILVPGS